jgi:hypothetical protein
MNRPLITKKESSYSAFLAVALVFILSSAQTCFANPISIDNYVGSVFLAIGVDLAADAAVLVICYSILREFDIVFSLEFIKYIFIVMVMGLGIDLLCSPALGSGLIGYSLVAFILLSFFNYTFSKSRFELTVKEALVVGLCMGIFTNPVISVIIFANQTHNL